MCNVTHRIAFHSITSIDLLEDFVNVQPECTCLNLEACELLITTTILLVTQDQLLSVL